MAEQKWPNKIILIRHGETVRNVRKEHAKQSEPDLHVYADDGRDQDTVLTEKGIAQARDVGAYLAEMESTLDTVFVSPYRRTRQTAEHILSSFGARAPQRSDAPKIVVEERVREIEFGVLDGLTAEGIKSKYPDEYKRRAAAGKYWYRPLGGESRPDVALRIHSFLGTLTRDYRGQTVAVVAHSVVVLCFRRLLERWGEDEYLQVDREDDVKNCSLTIYRCRDGRMALEVYNQLC